MCGAVIAHRGLPFELGLPVKAQRPGLIALEVGDSLSSIVDVIGRDVDKESPHGFRRPTKYARCDRIDRACHLRFVFSLVNVRISRSIHDHIRANITDRSPDRLRSSEIEARSSYADDLRAGHQRAALAQRARQLALGSCHQDTHDRGQPIPNRWPA